MYSFQGFEISRMFSEKRLIFYSPTLAPMLKPSLQNRLPSLCKLKAVPRQAAASEKVTLVKMEVFPP